MGSRFFRVFVALVLLSTLHGTAFGQRDWWSLPARVDGLAIDRPYAADVLIEQLSERATSLGLTEARIRGLLQTRLRELGISLTDERQAPYLYVNLTVLSTAATVTLEFKRRVEMVVDGERVPKYATVWKDLVLLTYPSVSHRDGDRVMEALGDMLASFAADFILANP
jgi:hypothetical protein